MSDLVGLFDSKGNCPTLGDPYRKMSPTAKLIFGQDGDVKVDVYQELVFFIKENDVDPFSDIVKIIMADDFAGNTKGNYTAIYMWR